MSARRARGRPARARAAGRARYRLRHRRRRPAPASRPSPRRCSPRSRRRRRARRRWCRWTATTSTTRCWSSAASCARKGAPRDLRRRRAGARPRAASAPAGATVAVPVFDRDLDLARAGGAHRSARSTGWSLVEGNYLLLDAAALGRARAALRPHAASSRSPRPELRRRLVDRWLRPRPRPGGGRGPRRGQRPAERAAGRPSVACRRSPLDATSLGSRPERRRSRTCGLRCVRQHCHRVPVLPGSGQFELIFTPNIGDKFPAPTRAFFACSISSGCVRFRRRADAGMPLVGDLWRCRRVS